MKSVSRLEPRLYSSVDFSQPGAHGRAEELLSQADPWECREFLPDAPGHSALAASTHSSSASPLTPTPLTDTAQRADTWL